MDQTPPALPAIKPELLAPGGNLDKCRIAFLYGADAVYAAGKDFGLRGFAHNLDGEELAEAVFYAHRHGRKIYIAVNVFARQADLKKMPAYLEYLDDLGVDALIISDPGVLLLARRHAPRIPIHLSTQANTTNSSSILFWRDQGVRRVNLARELGFHEIAEITDIAVREQVEIEVFVHGAMCMSYSGRCLMSAFLNKRGANSGFCTQPCRWSYNLVEEKRPGEFFPVIEDSRGAYIFNSKDLCLIEHIGELRDLGIRSFKIEGRMKGALYLASVTRAYRQAIDRCAQGAGASPRWPDRGCKPLPLAGTGHETGTGYAMGTGHEAGTGCEAGTGHEAGPSWTEDLLRVSHRPYTKGFLFEDAAAPESTIETDVSYIQTHTLAGIVRAFPDESASGRAYLEVRSPLERGQVLEFLFPDGASRFHVLDNMEDTGGNRLSQTHPNRWIRFTTEFPVFPFQVVRTLNGQNRRAGNS
ncbi:MAG: U32 family peptidase [Syntrophobacteraceae bacterium]